MKMIKAIGGGSAIKSLTIEQVKHSAGIGFLCLDKFDETLYIKAGMAMEQFWIEANKLGFGVHPIVQMLFLLLKYNAAEGLDESDFSHMSKMKKQFFSVLPELENKQAFFIFRFTDADRPMINSFRKKIEDIYFEAQ
jgi:hypothetical protein